jgi:hypothetical protein
MFLATLWLFLFMVILVLKLEYAEVVVFMGLLLIQHFVLELLVIEVFSITLAIFLVGALAMVYPIQEQVLLRAVPSL